jgi:hypothetical protein
MSLQLWSILGVAALACIVFVWWRMPVYQWYCRRCRRVVSSGRLHPKKCLCGTNALVDYVCKSCASWNTSPKTDWHCTDCSSTAVALGVEYNLGKAFWTWRNP